MTIRGKDSPLQVSINETQTVTLSHTHSVFSIEYAGLYFTDPENIEHKYRLKGFIDENWQHVGKERKVTYTNLNPAHYVFEVAVANHTGKNISRSLSIRIMPPWWQTWWARLLLVLFLGASLRTIYKLRLRSIKIRNKKLEKEVTERTVSLRKANGALNELNKLIHIQKEEIQAQAEELERSNHRLEEMVDIRTTDLKNLIRNWTTSCIGYRTTFARRCLRLEMDKDLQGSKEYLKMIKKSINKLDGFVKDILDYSRNSRMKVEREEIDFSQLVADTLEELQYLENADKLEAVKDFCLKAPYYNDPKRLYIIFRNLFSNAIKYQNSKIDQPFLNVKIISEKDGVVITLKDNGIGIAATESARVFDMFYRGSDLSTGSGIGLYIVKETVEKLNGNICMQSQFGTGTIFTIKLPNMESEI